MAEGTLIDEIVKLVAEISGRSDVRPESRLLRDLGIDGNQARVLLGELAARYDVDLSALQWQRYFDNEGFDFVEPFLVMAARRIDHRFDARWRAALDAEREISVRHLADAVEAGHWFEPEERREAPGGPLRAAFAVALALPILFLFLVAPLLAAVEIARRLAAGESAAGIALVPLLGLGGALVIWSSITNIRRKLATAPR
ncbi:MAG: DUF1493 family protein [Hyphomonadaceae bacterium]